MSNRHAACFFNLTNTEHVKTNKYLIFHILSSSLYFIVIRHVYVLFSFLTLIIKKTIEIRVVLNLIDYKVEYKICDKGFVFPQNVLGTVFITLVYITSY